MRLRDEIFRLLEEGNSTLVFPTENSARWYLSEYVRERGCSVLASRAIAFDEFAALFAPRHEDRKPANKYHRLSFISSLLEGGRSGLSYLYRDSFISYSQRFVPFLSRSLPSLNEIDGGRIVDLSLFRDLSILKDRYSDYLEKHALFEPGWESHSLKNNNGAELDHILVGYDAEIPMQRLMEELGHVKGVGFLTLPECISNKYEKYSSEEAELEALFTRLVALRNQENPCSYSDIILSTPDIDLLLPRLERKSREYGIPLVYMKSLKLVDTVPGRFLKALERCSDENLSFHSLENLLLDTSFPYQDIDRNRKLIRFMIDSNVQRGSIHYSKSDVLFAKLSREKSPLLDFYKALKGAIVKVNEASDGKALISSLHGICTLLFGEGEFENGSREDMSVYSFLISELNHFSNVLKESGLAVSGLFSLFMSDAESISYVSQEKREGIPVYTYGQDYLMDPPYRFVFGLNDRSYLREERALPFLEDHEIESRRSYSTTPFLVRYYQSTAANTFISGAATTYEGPAETPSYFVQSGNYVEIREVVPEIADIGLKSSLDMADRTSLAVKGRDVSTSDKFGYRTKDGDGRHLSYSSLTSYVNCPYRAFLELELLPTGSDRKKSVVSEFEPARQDDAKIGSFLHKVIQSFMERHFDELLTIEHIEEYYAEIGELMDHHLEMNRIFDDYTKKSIRGKYLDPLKNVLLYLFVPKNSRANAVGPFRPKANELGLEDERFTGYVDTVIEDAEGRTYLIDYKKGNAPVTYQLILYRQLYEKEKLDDVEDVFFYSMKDSRFNGFSPDKWEEFSLKLEEDYERTVEGYREGNWKATPGKDNCTNCLERGVCRRRYNLQ